MFGPDAEEARQEFGKEIAIDPKNAGAEYVLGELARQKQDWPEAITHFRRAAEIDSTFKDAFLGPGAAYLSAGHYQLAMA